MSSNTWVAILIILSIISSSISMGLGLFGLPFSIIALGLAIFSFIRAKKEIGKDKSTETWAVMIIIVIVTLIAIMSLILNGLRLGAILYFSSFHESVLLPEVCEFRPAYLECKNPSLAPNEVRLVLWNGFGRDIVVNEVTAESREASCTLKGVRTEMQNAQSNEFILSGSECKLSYSSTETWRKLFDVIVVYNYPDEEAQQSLEGTLGAYIGPIKK